MRRAHWISLPHKGAIFRYDPPVFWLGEVDFPPSEVVLVVCLARSPAFGAFSLKKKSFVFRNSKSLFSDTGSRVTFSTILGSSRAPSVELTTRVKEPKAKTAAANLIRLIKPGFESGVNEQPHIPVLRLLWNLRESASKFRFYD